MAKGGFSLLNKNFVYANLCSSMIRDGHEPV
jgi:hypothetical protein